VAIIRQLLRGNHHVATLNLVVGATKGMMRYLRRKQAGLRGQTTDQTLCRSQDRRKIASKVGPADRATSGLSRQLPLFSRACDASVCGVAGFFDERVIRSTVR
jgi:hypothetical protein